MLAASVAIHLSFCKKRHTIDIIGGYIFNLCLHKQLIMKFSQESQLCMTSYRHKHAVDQDRPCISGEGVDVRAEITESAGQLRGNPAPTVHPPLCFFNPSPALHQRGTQLTQERKD